MTFLPGCMGDSLVLGLTAINVLGFYKNFFVGLCVIRAEAGNIYWRCITSIIKFPFSKKMNLLNIINTQLMI